jgi:4-amino-4-deoxy-L-arabinose transferase-like glycosyltransferase
VLALLVAVSSAVRFFGSQSFEAPWIAPDEEIYALLGRSLWETGAFEILGASAPYYSALYPALVGLPFAVAGAGDGLLAVQALQALVMSSVAVPVYLWGRTLVSTTWALAAAALALFVPALAYSGLVMSETLFYVVTTWALWALARALERPSAGRQVVAGLAVAAAVLTRLQAVVLLPALLVAVALLAGFTRSTVPFRRFAVAFGLVAGGAIVWVAVRAVEGGSWQEVLGAYATVAEREYSLGRAAEFVAWHLADVALLTLGIPLLALLVLVAPALHGREGDARVRAFLAVAVAYVALLAVEVGAFASRFVGHLAERQLITAGPPLFLALALWLYRGAPRPQPAASLAALLVGAAVLLLPVRDLVVPEAAPDAFFTIPLEQLADATSATTMETTYLVGAVLVLGLFVFLPRRATPALAVLVAVGLIATSVVATSEVSGLSRRERVRVFGAGDPAWVDRSADGPVSLLWTGERYWPAVWEHLFWNRRIGEVLRMTDQQVPGPVPQRPATLRADGTLFDASGGKVDPALLVASRSLTFAGDRLGELPATPDHDALVLWRPERPARVLTWATGVLPNGDLMGLSRVQVFDCGPGRLELTLLGKEGKPFLVRLDGRVVYRRTLAPGEIARPKLAAPTGARRGTRCVYELDSAGLMGSTRVDFVRAG